MSLLNVRHFLDSLSDADRREYIEFASHRRHIRRFTEILDKVLTNPEQALTPSEIQVLDAYLKWIGPLPPVDPGTSDESADTDC